MAIFAGETRTEQRTARAGDYVILCAQPLGRIAAYLLEPESNDGFTTWNFFDDSIEVGKDHPVVGIDGADELKLSRIESRTR